MTSFGVVSATFRAPGGELYVERAGSGEQTLVFVHGLTCDLTDWRLQMEALSDRFRVVAIDLPGHGRSGKPSRPPSMESCAEDVLFALQWLGIDRAVFVGHSMGCRVVLDAYLQAPDRFEGIVLADGSIAACGAPEFVARETRRTLSTNGFSSFVRDAFGNMFFENSNKDLSDRILSRALKLDPDVGIDLRVSNGAWDAGKLQSTLIQINVPLLAIQSTKMDSHFRRASLRQREMTPWLELVQRLVANSCIVSILGFGHSVMLEAPERVSAVISEFLLRRGSSDNPGK